MLADTVLRRLSTDKYASSEIRAGFLPNLLGAKTSSCPDGPPHRGRQIVLLRHVRVQQGSRWKGAQPW